MSDIVQRHVQPARLEALLYDAVCEYSPTYAEQPAVSVFERAIMDADLRLETQTVDTPGAEPDDPRRNLIIRLGPDPVALLWLGHTDTVVLPDDEVLDPRVEDGILYGLGAADMKSGCAAAVEAAIAIHASGVQLKRGIVLALVVGEEEYGDGAERLLERVRAPMAIVGEPTGLRPCFEHYGYLEAELETRGRRAHAAVPEHGANAIHAMLAWLTQVLEVRAEVNQDLVLNPRSFTGSSPLFAVPEACNATLDAHLRGDATPATVAEIIDRARARALEAHAGVQARWEEVFYAPGYALDDEDPRFGFLRESYESAGLPWVPTAFRSHSDASLLAQRGIPSLVIGPGELSVAHTPDERVRLSEVTDAARLYAEIFLRAAGVEV